MPPSPPVPPLPLQPGPGRPETPRPGKRLCPSFPTAPRLRVWLRAACLLPGLLAQAVPPDAHASASASSQSHPPAARLTLYAGLGVPGFKTGFNDLSTLVFLDQDPALARLGLNGKWLAGDRDGLKVVSPQGPKAVLFPGSPKDLGVIAVRPPDCGPEQRLHVVLAQNLPGRPDRNRLWSLDPDGKFRVLADQTCFGILQGLVLARDGTLLVADSDRRELRKVWPSGHVTTLVRIPPRDTEDRDYTTFDPLAIPRLPPMINGLAQHPVTGDLYVADGHMIHRVDPDGKVTPLLGDHDLAAFDLSNRFMAAGRPCLHTPTALHVIGKTLFIVDAGNHAIRMYNLDARILKTLVGHPANGSVAREGPLGYGNPPEPWEACAALGQPTDLSFRRDGTCLVAAMDKLYQLESPRLAFAMAEGAPRPAPVQAHPPAPRTLWEALQVPVRAYDPDAVSSLLAQAPEGARLNEPYAGPEPRLSGATPLMRMLDYGDEDNALTLIGLMAQRGEANWNAAFTDGPDLGINTFLHSVRMACFRVSTRLLSMPEVDTVSASAFEPAARERHPDLRPSLLYAFFREEVDLVKGITARNAHNPAFWRMPFQLAPGTLRSLKQYFSEPAVLSYWKWTPYFREVHALIRQAANRRSGAPTPTDAPASRQASPVPGLAEAPTTGEGSTVPAVADAPATGEVPTVPGLAAPPAPTAENRRAALRATLTRELKTGCSLAPLREDVEELKQWLGEFERLRRLRLERPDATRSPSDAALPELQAAIQAFEALPLRIEADERAIQERQTALDAIAQEPLPADEAALQARVEALARLKTDLKAMKKDGVRELAMAKDRYQTFEHTTHLLQQAREARAKAAAALAALLHPLEPRPPAGDGAAYQEAGEHPQLQSLRSGPDQARTVTDLRLEHVAFRTAKALREAGLALVQGDQVRTVVMADCKVDGDLNQLLKPMAYFEHLEALHLNRLHLGPPGVPVLESLLAWRPALKVFDVAANDLTLAALDRLCATLREGPHALETLVLSRNPLGDQGPRDQLLAYLAQPNPLKHLGLGGCALGDYLASNVMMAVAQSATLEALDLSSNGLTAKGGRAIAALLKLNRHLKVLDLSGHAFDEATYQQLLEAAEAHPCLADLRLQGPDPVSEQYQALVDQALKRRP